MTPYWISWTGWARKSTNVKMWVSLLLGPEMIGEEKEKHEEVMQISLLCLPFITKLKITQNVPPLTGLQEEHSLKVLWLNSGGRFLGIFVLICDSIIKVVFYLFKISFSWRSRLYKVNNLKDWGDRKYSS